ncbi:outer membrane beta-barrel protein [Flavobacterium selenitireducens]|uniref:outer membrane beta-barrel protein n=1 Tax=Flavobacterium selenitireducens TaxID=2722704 RepID=UPI00168BBAED|nr:outer membrane beta-barrel protein [Flavobacterium selenitireducens]MBD3582599.1 PorT family protein [Flavobacterium selenitireducens]
MRFLLFCCLCAFSALGQIKFEPGYYINVDGTKISGLVRNLGWKNNPVAIDFKSDATAPVTIVRISEIKEFGVGSDYVFRKFQIQVDLSSKDIDRLSPNKNPEWQPEVALLKVVTSGKSILYEYNDHNLRRFFVSTSTTAVPEQLVAKEYRLNDKIGYNNTFRQQLFHLMGGAGLVESDFSSLNYNEDDLVRIFNKYNGEQRQDLSAAQSKGDFNVRIVAGVMFAKMAFSDERVQAWSDVEFGQKTIPSIGAEFEYILPFNRNKWGILLGAGYQSYKSDARQSATRSLETEYSFIEVPVGLRHYFFATDKLAVFLNVGYNVVVKLDSHITYRNSAPGGFDNRVEITRSSNVMAGAGIQYGRLAAEFRLHAKRDVLDLVYLDANYQSFGLLVSYKVL